jgi:chromosome segregation ATPase
MDINNIISDIESKAKRLKVRMERLEKENEELRNSVFEYLGKLEANQQECFTLKKEIETAKIGQLLQVDKKQTKREIDKYIHMIEKCISAINTSQK